MKSMTPQIQILPTDTFDFLFTKSKFYFLQKSQVLSDDLIDLSQRIVLPQATERFHPDRRREYILGRVCASKAYEMCVGSELLSLPSLASRAPQWPADVIGSISHDQNFVAAVVALKADLLAVGLDFEVIGRTKPEIAPRICNEDDVQNHSSLSEAQLLTVIFSAKESLYKALYPIVNVFFGFEAAAVKEIDVQAKTFIIELRESLSSSFSKKHRFNGRFIITQGSCLTVIEVLKL